MTNHRDSLARTMATLEGLGFNRVDPSPQPMETVPVAGGRRRVTASRASMGTLVSVTGIHASGALVEEAAGLAFQEMNRLVDLLNRYDARSALSVLNSEGLMRGPPPELLAVTRGAQSLFLASSGAFDPTVQPLVDLLREEGGSGGPHESRLQEALALVDGARLAVRPHSIHLGVSGMGLTLDGIAKGYIVDEMASVLRARGLDQFLINAGGDIRCSGFREDGTPWRVGVQDPGTGGDLPDVLALTGGAVATSGSYEIYFDPDRRYHHLVSARDGLSPQASRSVSVVAPDTMTADALATAVFVMGPAGGIDFIDSLAHCACLVVDHQGRHHRSKRWRSAHDTSTRRQG